jgi:acylphosphatase
MAAVHLIVSGRVQGVGYRYWMQQEAVDLGLSGWVRNRADGSVEMVVSGEGDAIAAMISRCHTGPAGASVNDIAQSVWTGAVPQDFAILETQ